MAHSKGLGRPEEKTLERHSPHARGNVPRTPRQMGRPKRHPHVRRGDRHRHIRPCLLHEGKGSERVRLILASASPRRKKLLKELFPDFEVRPADIEEVMLAGETPVQSAERLAMEKALKARETSKEGFILAADTLVTINGLVFGKPKGPIE